MTKKIKGKYTPVYDLIIKDEYTLAVFNEFIFEIKAKEIEIDYLKWQLKTSEYLKIVFLMSSIILFILNATKETVAIDESLSESVMVQDRCN